MRGKTCFKISPYRFVCEASEISRSAICASRIIIIIIIIRIRIIRIIKFF